MRWIYLINLLFFYVCGVVFMVVNNIIRQSESYGFVLDWEIAEMREEGYEDFVIVDSIDELISALEKVREDIC